VILTIDASQPVPPYEQIRSQLATMVASGVLAPGVRLPTIRQLAADLDIAPGTVTRAYRELEQSGDIRSRGRHGTFVAEGKRLSQSQRQALLASGASRYAELAGHLGVSEADALTAVRTALALVF
jgi:DNA-binding transcriptional regulator YhcF (GntR family)